MEKATLKTVLQSLTAGDTLTLNFRSDKALQSGEYTLVGTKKGRGKGGSLIAELKSVTSGDLFAVGTPNSDDLVNVIVNGTQHGFESESEIPFEYPTNVALAATNKEFFKTIKDATVESPIGINVVAPTVPELNGTFSVVSVVQLRGRGGQMVLKTAEGTEIWSYRHSGVIESISLVESTVSDDSDSV
jgi:hypothetical protein